MQRVERDRTSRRRGIALLYAVFGTFVAVSMVTVMFTMAGVTHTRAAVERGQIQARYVAEGGIDAAKKLIQESMANWLEPPAVGEVDVAGIVASYTIQPTGATSVVADPAGIQTIRVGFEVDSRAEVDGYKASAHRIINAEMTPIFQWAVFYIDDLEIQPGPNMTLGGRVHTNRDMYLGSNSTLRMDTNYVRAAGEIFRRRKDSNSSNGNVKIRRYVDNPFDPLEPSEYVRMNSRGQMDAAGVSGTASGYDSAFDGYDQNNNGNYTDPGDWLPFGPGALEFWSEPDGYPGGGHTVLTGEHGVGAASTPGVGSVAMYEPVEGGDYVWNESAGIYELAAVPGGGTHNPGYFHANAGLSIIVLENGEWQAFDLNGNDRTALLEGAVVVEGFLDTRQSNSSATEVAVVSINMEALNASGVFPANGLLYAAHYGMGEGTDAAGVLLQNGSEVRGGLTVVSEGSIYVQGDYNTENQQSCAVIGDAVNLLSNDWDGSKTPGTLPSAAETTFNCAMITGNQATSGSNYNGGLENLPRFHENWSGINCKISGSFVNAWESQYATALWQYGGDRYRAPQRRWNYDTVFNSVANLPPFTPMVVTASDVVSW